MTQKQLLLELDKIKILKFNEKSKPRLINPLTKSQRSILEALNLSPDPLFVYNYIYLSEEKPEDLRKISELWSKIKKKESLVNHSGNIWGYLDYHYLDSRIEKDQCEISTLQEAGVVLERANDFHVDGVYVYTQSHELDCSTQVGHRLYKSIKKVGANAEERLTYDGYFSAYLEHRWVLIETSTPRDLDYSAANRTAYYKYQNYCNNAISKSLKDSFVLRQQIGPVYKVESVNNDDMPLSVNEIETRIIENQPMYHKNGQRVAEKYYNDFSLLLFAYDAKIRQEQTSYRLLSNETSLDESDYSKSL